MTITRDIVIDLLPLYAAGEASADTRRLVESFIKDDASVAALLRALQSSESLAEVGAAPSAELERSAVNRTRAMIRRRSWTLALAIFFTLMPLTVAGDETGITFLMVRDEPGSALLWISAAYLWWRYARLTRELSRGGI